MSGGTGPATRDTDTLLLLLIGVAAAMWALSHVGDLSAGAVTWLLEHGVLVAPAAALVNLPGGVRAGLDAPRLALLAGVLVLAVVMGLRQRAAGVQQ